MWESGRHVSHHHRYKLPVTVEGFDVREQLAHLGPRTVGADNKIVCRDAIRA